jgi:hypothetical protein
MYDTIDVTQLDGLTNFKAAAGYVDGRFQTYAELPAHVPPGTHLLSITVFGNSADCIDCEAGDATNEQAAQWISSRLHTGHVRPVLYTSAGNVQTMVNLLWSQFGRARTLYRVWSAHYGVGEHICHPKGCGFPPVEGTQWTDRGPAGHANIDQSLMLDTFFPCDSTTT